MTQTLTLCATARLAQTLRATPPVAGQAVWQPLAATTIAHWLDALLEVACLSGQTPPQALLSPLKEHLLWEQVIAASLPAEAQPLFDTAGMAKTAAEAHALCEHWQIGAALRSQSLSLAEETRLFLGWQREFHKRCQQRGWAEGVRQQTQTLALIEAGELALPDAITFAGFDRFTPFEQRLRQALAKRGVQVSDAAPPEAAANAARAIACADRSAECAAAVRWAQQHLQQSPKARLGIVVPDLAGVRDTLEFALDDALHPEALAPAAAEAPRCYNFSLGRSLAGQAIVATALQLLALAGSRQLEQAALSALLLDPYWSTFEREADARALLDAAMRQQLDARLTLGDLLALARRLHAKELIHCPALLRQLADLLEAQAQSTKRRLPSAWAAYFERWLSAAQWPGDRTLSSAEYQARGSFQQMLGALAGLDELLGNISLNEAGKRLRELCMEQVFQPETRGQPAIQVLGILESTGLAFDALWVMGMNDHQWPAPARPNPLLPAELQRRAGSPHASAEVELAFASAVQRRLLGSAPDITFSFARQDGNQLLRPSPLIAGIAVSDDAPLSSANTGVPLESLEDWQAPPVAPGEKVSGGTGLLRAQAICPAWGYYQYRLGAQALKTPSEGLDAMERGTLVHGALEAFWQATRDSATLQAMTPEALAAAIASAVEQAITQHETQTEVAMPPRTRQLEAARLQRLLDRWLSFEREQRSAPFTVLVCEQESLLEIEGIRVRTIIDRVDQLADGRLLVIDYKTGQSIDIKNWASERITEPQLPIYAAIAVPQENEATQVAGVAFAKVLIDEPAFTGITEDSGLLPKITGLAEEKQKTFDPARFPDWQTLMEHWYWRLHAIAKEVQAGDASVRISDPKDLKYCEVLPLLRLAEAEQALSAEDAT